MYWKPLISSRNFLIDMVLWSWWISSSFKHLVQSSCGILHEGYMHTLTNCYLLSKCFGQIEIIKRILLYIINPLKGQLLNQTITNESSHM
jgi:hypothetical protein